MNRFEIKNKAPFRLSLGERGEMAAWNYLLLKGYKLLEKNFRCALGEIDVIAERENRLVFLEVKTRSSHNFGRPEEAVGPEKQRKLIQLAQLYLKSRNRTGPISFDVLSITWKLPGAPQFCLIKDAFDLPDIS